MLQDLRIAARSLLKEPGATAILLATLAVGTGGTTAIFSVVDAVLLKPLPFADSERLFRVQSRNSYPDMVDWAEGTTAFEGFGGYNGWSFDWLGPERPERIQAAIVTGDLLPLLGVTAARGRTLGPDDNVPGGGRVILTSHSFWMTRLGGDPAVIGENLTLDGEPFTIVGVLPPGFRLPGVEAELFTPHQVVSPETAAARGVHFLIAVGRLRDGETVEKAQAELDAVAARLEALYPAENSGRRFELEPWRSAIAAGARSGILLLFASVGVVLAIACANVAGLLLARTARREREIALRSALGATRARIVRQLLSESLLVGLLGSALGIVLAGLAIRALVAIAPPSLPRVSQIGIDGGVLLFAAVVSMLTSVLFGLAPAAQAGRLALASRLKEGIGFRGSSHRTRRALIVAEVALAVVLLVTAGLTLKSFYRLFQVELGFREESLVTMDFLLPAPEFRSIDKRIGFFSEVIERLEALPGVTGVAATTDLPFGGGAVPHNLAIEGRPVPEGAEPEIFYRGINAAYFDVMGIRLRQGRAFDESDREDSLPVAVVNETFAASLFPGESPLGRRVRWARRDEVRFMTIVGVVADIKPSSLDASEVEALYVPFRQEQDAWRNWMSIAVRADDRLAIETLERAVPTAVAAIDPDIPVANLRSMTGRIEESAGPRRFQLGLVGSFALVALFLAAVGLYGLLAHLVTEQRKEIGIRLALGARAGRVLLMVLGRALALTASGVALGSLTALGLSQTIASFLFGVSPRDPATFASIAILLAAVSLVASLLPAYRASRVDPLCSIRYE